MLKIENEQADSLVLSSREMRNPTNRYARSDSKIIIRNMEVHHERAERT